jgi:RNA polymerase sigma-70 factor (ECF subfamily)
MVREFIHRTHGPVYAMACGMTHDPDERQDWTHEALLRVLDELSRGNFVYRWPGCFWSWFGQRSRFILLNLRRKQRDRQSRTLEGDPAEAALESIVGPDAADPQRVLENVAIRDALEACLEGLRSEEHRRALTLVLLEECSYEEVAESMGSPLNTIRSWIRRARIAVRKCMAGKFVADTSAGSV